MEFDSKGPAAQRVVVVGGGFGGIRTVKALADAPVQITLIDQTNHHLFQPLLYQVATGVLSSGQIAPALRSLFRREDNVEVLLGKVEDVDLERHVVKMLAEQDIEVPYDTLVLAAGATHSYLGHDDWEQWAPGMKTLDDAIRLRTRILSAFELAEQAPGKAQRDAWLTFAVVGGGPTGVELSAQIALLAHRVLRGEYRHIDPSTARVILLDAVPTLLGDFPTTLRERAERDLRRLGVDVQLESPVVGVDPDGVTIGGEDGSRRIDAKTVLWAAGVRASPLGAILAHASGGQTDKAGRLVVGPDLTLPGRPEVFAIGDMISIPGVPGVAQPAMQEGKYVAGVIRARVIGQEEVKPFRYWNLGTMAVIGRADAVADLFGRIPLGGVPAFLIWGFVHLAYLVGWGNRVGAVSRWLWTVLARDRRERLISMTGLIEEKVAVEAASTEGHEGAAN